MPIPGRLPLPGVGRAPPIPEVVKQHFEARRGYANYYFNKQNRDRVLAAWTAPGDFASLGATWVLGGPLDGGGRFRFELADDGARLELPLAEHEWTDGDELGSTPAPPGSGGLLPALCLWRRLAVGGPDNFGEVYYLGTFPFPEREDLVDVLVGIDAGVRCRFFFDPADGRLLTMEMAPADDVDPCEIGFFDYRQVDGRSVPGRLEVRFGDEPYGSFRLDEFLFERPPEP